MYREEKTLRFKYVSYDQLLRCALQLLCLVEKKFNGYQCANELHDISGTKCWGHQRLTKLGCWWCWACPPLEKWTLPDRLLHHISRGTHSYLHYTKANKQNINSLNPIVEEWVAQPVFCIKSQKATKKLTWASSKSQQQPNYSWTSNAWIIPGLGINFFRHFGSLWASETWILVVEGKDKGGECMTTRNVQQVGHHAITSPFLCLKPPY